MMMGDDNCLHDYRVLSCPQLRRLSSTSTTTDATVTSALYRREQVSTAEALTKSAPIVQIYGACETVDTFCLELELMEERDLFDRLSQDGVFSEVSGDDSGRGLSGGDSGRKWV